MALEPRLQEIQLAIRTALAARLKAGKRRQLLLDWLKLGDNAAAGRMIWRKSGLVRLGRGPDAAASLQYTGIAAGDDAHAREHLAELLVPLLEEEIEAVASAARANAEKLVAEAVARCQEDADKRIAQLEQEAARCRERCEALERSQHPAVRFRLNWLYLVLLLIVVAFVGCVVWLGWADRPEVSIDFNVGEIIGGILAGAGALLAGGAYAAKALSASGE